MAIHIFTDSTSDLTAPVIDEFGVSGRLHVVPLTVHFGEKEYHDGVDLTARMFYDLLRSSPEMPRTSQPSPAAFLEMYQEVSQPGDTLLSFHISQRLSGTYQSALLAAQRLSDRRVEVVDTRSASLGLGLIALKAAQAASEGQEVQEILRRADNMIAGARILFAMETLEYLRKNGRIGRAEAMLGGLLSVKPILALEDGEVAPVEKARGTAKARERLVGRLLRVAPPDDVWLGAVIHADAPKDAGLLQERLQQEYPEVPLIQSGLGPTIGTHVGPGALGVVFYVR